MALALLLAIILALYITQCKHKSCACDELVFERITAIDDPSILGLPNYDWRDMNYMVSGYKGHDCCTDALSKFACSIINPDTILFDNRLPNDFRRIHIYKKSRFTNNEHIKKVPRDFGRITQGEESIIVFTFDRDIGNFYQFFSSHKYGYRELFSCPQ